MAEPTLEAAAAPADASELGVVIVAYQSTETIGPCLASIARYAPGAHVVVIDNSGQAAQISRVAQDGRFADSLSSLQVVDSETNVGYARGVNLGVGQLPAGCRYLLILNPDAQLCANPMDLVAGLEWADVTAGRVEGPRPNARRSTTYGVELWRSAVGERLSSVNVPRGVTAYVPALSGAYLLQTLRYYRAHPLDEYYDLYYEDSQYCDEARDFGRGVLLQDRLVGRHSGGASSGRVNRVPFMALRVSRLRYLRRRYPGLPGLALLAPFALERVVRGATRQPEGSQTRQYAWRAVLAELRCAGTVNPLAEAADPTKPAVRDHT